ncbi:MAG: hypothetical protein ACF8Q5_12315 [Phycisphaerales bacterium JB040]
MNRDQHDLFWRMYDQTARPTIERACRAASSRLTSNTMDPDEMSGWIHQRVWKLLERNAAPTFHDDPAPEVAVERLVEHAGTLARWSYMALSRRHWRREQHQTEHLQSMSRAERLSMVSTVGNGFEHSENLTSELDKLKKALGPDLSAKIAASWPEKSERTRIANALGATRDEDARLIQEATDGTMKDNTVQQMRSRAKRRASEIASAMSRSALALVAAALLALSLSTSDAVAGGEQSGGRGGNGQGVVLPEGTHASGGEQSGGRGGKGLVALDGEQSGSSRIAFRTGGGEQSGGRGG